MAVTIEVESPLQDEVRLLITELNAHLLTLTPPEFCSHMTVEGRIEALAREEGLTRLVPETGHAHHAAYRVYERGGFTRCGPILDYPDTGWSVFYEKGLSGSESRGG